MVVSLPHVNQPPPNLALMVIGRAMAEALWASASGPLPEALDRIVREIRAREAGDGRGRIKRPSDSTPGVLLVEDELIQRMHAAEVLEEAGFQVLECANAEIALAVLNADPHAVSVLVTDVHMPGTLDGCALAHVVKERWPWIRIVVTSAEAKLTSDDVPDCGRFIPKPWTPSSLLEAVECAGRSA